MSITIECGRCGRRYNVDDSDAGKKAECTACGAAIIIPAAGMLHSEQKPVPVAPLAAPAAGMPEELMANKLYAGRKCPVCKQTIDLGQAIRNCERCASTHHSVCWQAYGGCGMPSCANAPAFRQGGEAFSAEDGGRQCPFCSKRIATLAAMCRHCGRAMPGIAIRMCPFCAEEIPAAATVCPRCRESLAEEAAGWAPQSFRARTFFRKWSFSVAGDELVGQRPGRELRALREHVFLEKRRMILYTPEKTWKFRIDDKARIAVEYWQTGSVVPRTCTLANDALISAIVGIFICLPVLETSALIQASKAAKLIKAYPKALTGEGMVTAARVIAIAAFGLLALGIIASIFSN